MHIIGKMKQDVEYTLDDGRCIKFTKGKRYDCYDIGYETILLSGEGQFILVSKDATTQELRFVLCG